MTAQLISILILHFYNDVIKATRLVTSSEDDASPVVMVWDLRNARAPEKVTGQLRLLKYVAHMTVDLDWTREGRSVVIVVQTRRRLTFVMW